MRYPRLAATVEGVMVREGSVGRGTEGGSVTTHFNRDSNDLEIKVSRHLLKLIYIYYINSMYEYLFINMMYILWLSGLLLMCMHFSFRYDWFLV